MIYKVYGGESSQIDRCINQSRTKVVQGAKKRHLGPLFEESVPTYPISVLRHPPFFQKTTIFIYNQKKCFRPEQTTFGV